MRLVWIIGQRGATGWGWQIGKLYGQLNYPRYWRTSGIWQKLAWEQL